MRLFGFLWDYQLGSLPWMLYLNHSLCTLDVEAKQLRSLLRPPIEMGRPLYFATVVSIFFFLSSFFLAYSQQSEIGCLPYDHTWCGLSVNLECMLDCLKCVEQGSLKIHDAKIHHLGTIAQLCQAVSSHLRHVSTVGKKSLNSNISFMSPQYGKLRSTNGWDRFTSLGHPSKF